MPRWSIRSLLPPVALGAQRLARLGRRVLMSAGLAAATAGAIATPTLVGDSVTLGFSNTSYNAALSSAQVASAGGPEFLISRGTEPRWAVDIDALSVTFTMVAPGLLGPAWAVFTLGDLEFAGAPGGITGIHYDLAGAIDGFYPSQLSFTSHSLSLAVGLGERWPANSSLTVMFDVDHTVREPGALPLAACAAAAWARRRIRSVRR